MTALEPMGPLPTGWRWRARRRWWAEYRRRRKIPGAQLPPIPGARFDVMCVPPEPPGPLRRGDYVTVMVLGERRRARVVDPYTSLGNVSVDLEQSIEWHGGNGFDTPIRRLVRERAEVHRIARPDPSRPETRPFP